MEKKKILITGASGFIGGFLVQGALEWGYEVWAGVRATSSRANLQDKRIHFINLPYADREALTQLLKAFAEEQGGWHYIIHNAGLTKTWNKQAFFRVNATYTNNLIESIAAAGCLPEKFLLMSSLSSYGGGDEQTFRPISADDPQLPDTVYGQSKLDAENYLRQQSYFSYVILRPTGVYGPGEKDYYLDIKSIQAGFNFTVGFTPQQITFIYVKDLVTAAFLALENERIRNRHYFVADGDVYTDESFARMVQDILGKRWVWHARIPLPLVHAICFCNDWIARLRKKAVTLNSDKYRILKRRNWICDVTPLREELGFAPSYPLRRGLEETIAWYKEKGWL